MEEERNCPWCYEVLVQWDGENDAMFKRRKYCNKQHASFHQAAKRKGKSYK
jgi:hypothetical protein